MSQTKRYRLLKPLPDSEVGDVYVSSNSGEYFYKNGSNEDSYWMRVNVENNPTWFELIPEPSKEKEWKIILTELNGDIYTGDKLPEEIKKHGAIIKSVKRLSDGVVFSIGDEVCSLNSFIDKLGSIKEFKIVNNEMGVIIDGGMSKLNLIKKLPPSNKQEPKEEFTWDDELVIEYVGWSWWEQHNSENYLSEEQMINKFKQSKKPSNDFPLREKPKMDLEQEVRRNPNGGDYPKSESNTDSKERMYTEDDMHRCFLEGRVLRSHTPFLIHQWGSFEQYLKSINK